MDAIAEDMGLQNPEVLEAPSPFLSGTKVQYAWDSTSLGWLKTCPRLYYYNQIEGWRSREESVHLRFGIEYHKALQDYDTERAAGIGHDDAVHDVVRELLLRTWEWKSDHNTKNRDFLVRTVIWYLDKFENDPAETFIMENGKPAVEVSFRFELDYGPQARSDDGTVADQPYLLCGHLDRVVNFSGELYVMDRKTTGSTPSPYYFNQFEPNNQMTLYTLASQVVFQAPIRGVIIDAAQIGVGFSRFTRGFTYRTPDQIEEWLGDLRYWLRLAESFATEGHWPMNDTACDKFGGCKFREICSKSPQVREQFLKGNFDRSEPWNPLKTR
jgi:hypothetical protein